MFGRVLSRIARTRPRYKAPLPVEPPGRGRRRRRAVDAGLAGSCAPAVASLTISLLVLTGCTVGPNYRRPETPVPQTWAETSEAITTGPANVARWWTAFNDEQLDSLIDRAVRSNKDVQVARARVRQARAQRLVTASAAYPTLSSSGSYTHINRNLGLFGFGTGQTGTTPGGSLATGGASGKLDLYQVGLDASWELDLFGGVRRAVEAAEANIAASEENLRDVLVTLLAEVATDYITVRGNQRRIEIARENIAVQRQTVELTQGQFEAGLGTSLQVAQAQAVLANTEAQIPPLETSVRQSIHALGVLLGSPPETLLEELSKAGSIPPPPPEVPIGLPSDLLRRRPDVRQAERQLAAATAQIGVATAALFPSFSLTGTLGYESTKSSNLFSSANRYWTAGPGVSWPVFDAGKVRANIQVQTALQEQALAAYESTVLTALEDAENAIVAYADNQAARVALTRAVEANRKAAQMSRDLYQKGLVSFLNVLQGESSLYQSEDLLIQNEQQIATALVALFKALGGGWETLTTTEARQTTEDR